MRVDTDKLKEQALSDLLGVIDSVSIQELLHSALYCGDWFFVE